MNSNETNDSLSESEFSNNCFSESGLDNNDDIDDLNKSYKRLLILMNNKQLNGQLEVRIKLKMLYV